MFSGFIEIINIFIIYSFNIDRFFEKMGSFSISKHSSGVFLFLLLLPYQINMRSPHMFGLTFYTVTGILRTLSRKDVAPSLFTPF